MAKKKIETVEEKPKVRRTPIGVYLPKDTLAALLEIVKAEKLTIHSVLVYAITDFIRRYRSGEVKIEKEDKPSKAKFIAI